MSDDAWCQCAERPMCQWCSSPASVAVLLIWPTAAGRNQQIAARFACEDCWVMLQKPIPGIHKPVHGSEDWRPSIDECIRLALISERHQTLDFVPVLYRGYTPAQARSLAALRAHSRPTSS